MSYIHITKELSIHFSLFNCSFKLSGSLDILILLCIALNFTWILALQNLVCFFLFIRKKCFVFCPALKFQKLAIMVKFPGVWHITPFFAGTLIWYHTHKHTDTQHTLGLVDWHIHININLHHLSCAHKSYLYYNEWTVNWHQKFTLSNVFSFQKLLIRYYKTSLFFMRNGVMM